MTLSEIVQLLSRGQRTSLGQAPKVARMIEDGRIDVEDLIRVLLDHSENELLVLHGMHALRAGCEGDPRLTQTALRELRGRMSYFPQWEAQEQFCRLLLAYPKQVRMSAELWDTLLGLLASKKSIVANYALEALVVFGRRSKRYKTFAETILEDAQSHPIPAVRARARKLLDPKRTQVAH